MTQPILQIDGLSAGIEGKKILKGINLTISLGEVHAIMGPNGSGKSTLAAILAGREGYDISSGQVLYKGVDLLELDPEERARLHNLLAESTGPNAVVLLSTHIVSDVSNLCTRFAVIRGGEILAATSPEAALTGLEGRIWEATVPREQIADLKANGKVISRQMAGGNTRVRMLAENGKAAEPFTARAAPDLVRYSARRDRVRPVPQPPRQLRRSGADLHDLVRRDVRPTSGGNDRLRSGCLVKAKGPTPVRAQEGEDPADSFVGVSLGSRVSS